MSGCLRGPGLNPGLTRGRQLVSSPFEITSLCQYTIKIKQQICRLRARCEMINKDVMKFPNHPHKNCTQMQHCNEIGRSSNWMLYKHRSHCRLLKTERKRLSWWLLYCHLNPLQPHEAYIDGLVQERRNSIANALELRLSFTNQLICVIDYQSSLLQVKACSLFGAKPLPVPMMMYGQWDLQRGIHFNDNFPLIHLKFSSTSWQPFCYIYRYIYISALGYESAIKYLKEW